jgi:hypothetical protein
MKKIWFYLLFLIFILFPFPIFAGHVCNQWCTGAANITCNETTGTLSYNQGSCNAGLACYSGAGNVCRNPYCPTDTDCSCPTFTIQGYKQPNQSPFSGQTISLDGGSPTTAQPYYFNNVAANTIHRVSASSPADSSVGYTLCYNNTNCHSNPPTSGSSVYICTNNPGTTNYADLWWHYTPLIPNAKNISGPSTIFVGDEATYQADYEDYNASLTNASMYVYQDSCLGTSLTRQESFSGPGTYHFNWTPSASGNYTVYAKADAASASCIGYQTCTGSPPNYDCPGPNTSLSVSVQNPGPWYKLKDASLNKIGDHNIAVVQNVNKFSDSDTDDTTTRYTIINSTNYDPGILLATGYYNPGPSYNPIPDSVKGWYIGSYGTISQPMFDSFYQYLKSRKQIEEKTDISQIDKNGIYFIKTDGLTISTQPPNYNFVLIVRTDTDLGDVNITVNGFNSSNKSIMILAKNITFSSSVTTASGIFIATQFTYQSSNGLKILGNLISKNAVEIQQRSDNTRPSLFIVFKPQMYLDLLSYLSISKYDWQQLQ